MKRKDLGHAVVVEASVVLQENTISKTEKGYVARVTFTFDAKSDSDFERATKANASKETTIAIPITAYTYQQLKESLENRDEAKAYLQLDGKLNFSIYGSDR